MSARDDYPLGSTPITDHARVWGAMCDELDRARAVVDALRGSELRWLGNAIRYRTGTVQRVEDSLAAYDGGVAMPTLQRRCVAWHEHRFPDADQWKHFTKVVEEVGEVARAMVGDNEGRPGRGDVVDECAQVVLTLVTLVGRWYPDRDLLVETLAEMSRHENDQSWQGF